MATSPEPSDEYARLLSANARYASHFERSDLPATPRRRVVVITCMDARITMEDVLGLRTGDAHIIRNAGGLVTDDALRSVVISRHLGSELVLIVQHTGCAMLSLREEEVQRGLAGRTGVDMDIALLAFDDLEQTVATEVARLRAHPWTRDLASHGLIYDVATGRLREVV